MQLLLLGHELLQPHRFGGGCVVSIAPSNLYYVRISLIHICHRSVKVGLQPPPKWIAIAHIYPHTAASGTLHGKATSSLVVHGGANAATSLQGLTMFVTQM